MSFRPGQLVENRLLNGSVIVCRVIEKLDRPGMEGMYRLTDARETESDATLIRTNRTWGAPVENILTHQHADCCVCQEEPLPYFG